MQPSRDEPTGGYTARQAIRILHMGGRVELEATHDEPDDH